MSAAGGRPRLRALHTSDVHLGAYDSGSVELRQSIQDTFARVIDVGIAEGVDLMLIAGDFFDNARVRPETLAFAVEQLARLGVPVVLNPGNHDHVGPGSVYDRIDLEAETGNVRLMRAAEGETVAIEELDVEVWGRSHTEQLPDFSPFGDPRRAGRPRGSSASATATTSTRAPCCTTASTSAKSTSPPPNATTLRSATGSR